MLVMFARGAPDAPSAPWQQQGLQIQGAALKTIHVAAVVNTVLVMPWANSQGLLRRAAGMARPGSLTQRLLEKNQTPRTVR